MFITTEGCGPMLVLLHPKLEVPGLGLGNGVAFHWECYTPQSGTSRKKSGEAGPQSGWQTPYGSQKQLFIKNSVTSTKDEHTMR